MRRHVRRQDPLPCQPQRLDDVHHLSIVMNTAPFTRSQIFALLWMTVVIAYLFGGPRNCGPAPTPIAFAVIGATLFSLIVLGKRFPWFGLFLLMLLSELMRGGRRRRWWGA
jgi:hypothetical protein